MRLRGFICKSLRPDHAHGALTEAVVPALVALERINKLFLPCTNSLWQIGRNGNKVPYQVLLPRSTCRSPTRTYPESVVALGARSLRQLTTASLSPGVILLSFNRDCMGGQRGSIEPVKSLVPSFGNVFGPLDRKEMENLKKVPEKKTNYC